MRPHAMWDTLLRPTPRQSRHRAKVAGRHLAANRPAKTKSAHTAMPVTKPSVENTNASATLKARTGTSLNAKMGHTAMRGVSPVRARITGEYCGDRASGGVREGGTSSWGGRRSSTVSYTHLT